MLLLNPGPVVLTERVRQAMLRPDLCHREPEFAELQSRIRENLTKVYDLETDIWTAVLVTGSGTSAMEAMVSSIVPANGNILIIENGVYGERLSKIAAIHNINHSALTHDWDKPINLVRLELTLRDGNFSHVAVVHHETTTGRLNDIDGVARTCKEFGIPLLLDAVSSFGAEDIRFDEWNLAACAATANKCLHAVPGTSFVMVRRDAVKPADTPARTLYLNLASYYDQQEAGGTPFTQSVQTFYALDEALLEFFDAGGWQERRDTYRRLAGQVRKGLKNMGIMPLLNANEISCVLNAYFLPVNVDYPELHDKLKDAGFVIYAGQASLAEVMFRISTMGKISKDDIQRLLDVIADIIDSDGNGV